MIGNSRTDRIAVLGCGLHQSFSSGCVLLIENTVLIPDSGQRDRDVLPVRLKLRM